MALLYRPINAASRMKGSITGRITRRIFRRVFIRRTRRSTPAEADQDKDTSDFDILCAGENAKQQDVPPIEPHPVIHPLKGQPLIPRIDAHVPEVDSGRHEILPSDCLTSVVGDASVAEGDDTILSVDLDDFPSAPTGVNKRAADVNEALEHLIGATPLANERAPPHMRDMERRPRVVPQQSTQDLHAKEYMKHRRMKTRNSNLMRRQSRRSRHSRRLSFEQQSIEKEDSMLLMVESDCDRMAMELPRPELDIGALRTRSQIIEAAIPNHKRRYRSGWEAWLKDYHAVSSSSIPDPDGTFSNIFRVASTLALHPNLRVVTPHSPIYLPCLQTMRMTALLR